MSVITNMQIITNEMRLTNNNLPDGVFDINPRFSRKIGVTEDEKQYVELSVEIADTPEKRFPINLYVSITGIFELNNLDQQFIDNFLEITAVQILFPYLRSLVSSLTASSFMPPIVFPVIDVMTLFSDDDETNSQDS